MQPGDRQLSGYANVWLFALFDLPTKTKSEKKAYSKFRSMLLDEGFSQMQYSVYARFCDSEATATTHRSRIRKKLPDDGQVRLMTLTDRQFEKMEVYFGKKRVEAEEPPSQLELF